MTGSIYARVVPKLHRSRKLPKIDRPWRPRMIAWAGPTAFYPNRFYEQDKWYKARIDKPQNIPQFHLIDPDNHRYSLEDLLKKPSVLKINIGFASRESQPDIVKTAEEKSVLEQKSRKMELLIDLESTKKVSVTVFDHFNIFKDSFGEDVYFENVQSLDVSFDDNAVHTGNVISACNTKGAPTVEIESLGEGFNSLFMVNLDGNGYGTEGQVVQWMVNNIPDGKSVADGQEVVPYLQPLPFYGTGYHRVMFVLFRHEKPLTPSSAIGSQLHERTFDLRQFYKQNENVITPSAALFFQTSYDESVKTTLHSLGLKSPLYSYEYNEALKPNQKEFPEKPQPFDLYLDMYRDPKQVEVELLEQRLRTAQLNDIQEPEWLDLNYNENKKNLPAWIHRRMLNRKGKAQSLYKNEIVP